MDILFTTHYLAASALPSVGHELAVLTFYVETCGSLHLGF